MAQVKVTAKSIAALPDGMHRVERGLYVRKRKGRRDCWFFVYQIMGKRKEISIGPLESVTITQARAEADRFRHLIDTGVDPLGAKKERLKSMRDAGGDDDAPYTVSQLINDALPVVTETKRWRNAKHAGQWESTLRTYAEPIIGSVPVEDVTREDILAVLRPIWDEKTETASRLRGRLESIFSFAIATGKRQGLNPCLWRGNLELFLPPPSKVKTVEHHDALTVDEAKELFDQWRPPKSITACAILFGALTCARVGEFVPARWDEIDFENRVWNCPLERRKDGKRYPHRVPLSDQALYVLGLIKRKSEYIFAGASGPHISKETPRVIIQKKLKHGTMHGFRSTFRDWAAENGFDRVLAEKSLMHATGNEVEQAYQRSDLLEQRRPLLQAWADEVYGECDE